jgi:2-dehydropantoate 2-reductase
MTEFNGRQIRDLKICVAGAGAIGLTLAARLVIAGFRVNVLARGENLQAIRTDGIRLIDAQGEHHLHVVAGTASELPVQDIVFLCPKSQDMANLAEAVQPMLSEQTIIVPVVNGIPFWYFDGIGGNWNGRPIGVLDSEGIIKKHLPSRQIIGTTTIMTVERLKPGTARTFNPLQMTIGELSDQWSGRAEMLSEILNLAGIETRITNSIRDAVWTKVVRNLITNPVSAITGATLRENFGNRYLVDICRQMLDEVIPVISAYGARLEVDPETILSAGRKMGDVKTSMLQDLERGAPLELASICDAVVELAQTQGIAMPVTKAIIGLARFRSLADGDRKAA